MMVNYKRLKLGGLLLLRCLSKAPGLTNSASEVKCSVETWSYNVLQTSLFTCVWDSKTANICWHCSGRTASNESCPGPVKPSDHAAFSHAVVWWYSDKRGSFQASISVQTTKCVQRRLRRSEADPAKVCKQVFAMSDGNVR